MIPRGIKKVNKGDEKMKKKALMVMLMAALLLVSCGKEQGTPGKEVAQTVEGTETQESTTEEQEEGTGSQSGEPGSPESEAASEPETEVSSKEQEESKEDQKTGEDKQPESKPEKESQTKPSGESGSSDQKQDSGTTKPSAPPAESKPEQPPHTTCSFDGGKVTTAATCGAEGVKTYTCTVCGKTKTESIPKTDHNYTTESKSATCTENGYTKTYCTMCGNVQSESTQTATGHDMHEEWFEQPTCTSGGQGHVYRCSKCGIGEALPNGGALGHEPDAGTVYIEGTCTRPARISHVCTRCGCDMEDTLGGNNPDNHDWGIDPEDGVEYCAECGLTK